MYFVPSPIHVIYQVAYLAKANASGRMQYYRIQPGKSKERISRGEFIEAYNNSNITALKPLQANGSNQLFQMEFFVNIKIPKVTLVKV